MCDEELMAAIFEELGYLDETKEKVQKDEVHEKESTKDNSTNSGEEQQK
jgi:hypothetical protein